MIGVVQQRGAGMGVRVACVLVALAGVWAVMEPPTTSEKEMMVDIHNRVRASMGASNMNYMTWDDDLAVSAELWAKQCKAWRHPAGGYSGQNLYWSTAQHHHNATPGHRLWLESVKEWLQEYTAYNYTSNDCVHGKNCGHYLMLTWANASQIGCGRSHCPRMTTSYGEVIKDVDYVVCNYNDSPTPCRVPYRAGRGCFGCASGSHYCIHGLCCNGASTKDGKNCSCPVCDGCSVPAANCSCTCREGWMGIECKDRCDDYEPAICKAMGKNWPWLCNADTGEGWYYIPRCPKSCHICNVTTNTVCPI